MRMNIRPLRQISLANSERSGEPANPRSLARAFAIRTP